MSELQIALSVGAGLIALMGFSFGVFWKIISSVKLELGGRCDDMQTEITSLQEKVSDKMPYTYGDLTYQRKDTHTLEVSNLMLAISNLTKKFDDFVVEYKKNHNK